ncbi:MAG: ABC transporter ATP-binding protein [Acidobacteria bacterium]|nr:ABC transporter ATP-binding protein [Acidobacteriota bacterium]
MADPIIADALRRAFGSKTAVDDVSLHVPAGKAVGLIGANGAGKSTLLKMLVGLLQPSRGRATLMGHDTRTLPASVFARVGYMAECQHLPAVRTVRDLLAYCRPLYRTWDAALATRLLDLLTLSPSTGLVRASRGERMKAALVATLAFHPDVLVLDEPLEGLDPLTREQVVDGLLELVSAEGAVRPVHHLAGCRRRVRHALDRSVARRPSTVGPGGPTLPTAAVGRAGSPSPARAATGDNKGRPYTRGVRHKPFFRLSRKP